MQPDHGSVWRYPSNFIADLSLSATNGAGGHREGSGLEERYGNMQATRGCVIARGCWRWLLAAAATAVFVLCLPEPTAAQERQLLIDPDNRPLVIKGVLGEFPEFLCSILYKETRAQPVTLLGLVLRTRSDYDILDRRLKMRWRGYIALSYS